LIRPRTPWPVGSQLSPPITPRPRARSGSAGSNVLEVACLTTRYVCFLALSSLLYGGAFPNFKHLMLISSGSLDALLGFRALIFGFCDDVAPHMAVGTDRRAKKTATRLEQALLLQPVHNAMSYNASNHSPGVVAPVAETTSTPSPTDRLDSVQAALTGQEPITSSIHHSSKKRRSSKSKVPSDLRRTSSTPHMRHLALETSGELSPTSNKPRNKLGYHRTSVACGK
jgi:hypothetical protein